MNSINIRLEFSPEIFRLCINKTHMPFKRNVHIHIHLSAERFNRIQETGNKMRSICIVWQTELVSFSDREKKRTPFFPIQHQTISFVFFRFNETFDFSTLREKFFCASSAIIYISINSTYFGPWCRHPRKSAD